jgi:hypothetical protein
MAYHNPAMLGLLMVRWVFITHKQDYFHLFYKEYINVSTKQMFIQKSLNMQLALKPNL